MYYGQASRRPNGSMLYGLPPQRESGRHARLIVPFITWAISHLDVLTKFANPSSTNVPSDKSCLLLLKSIFPEILPEAKDHRPRVRGSVARLPAMLGAMREILVRQGRIDSKHEVMNCKKRVEDGRLGEELMPVSHSQVRRADDAPLADATLSGFAKCLKSSLSAIGVKIRFERVEAAAVSGNSR
jgi:hypothetical protein